MAHPNPPKANRSSFRKIRIRANLPSLEVPNALEDGRIPLEFYDRDLEIQIPNFSGLKKGDQLKLYLHQNYFGQNYTLTAEDEQNPDFVVRLSIEKEKFPPEGGYIDVQLEYEYIDAGTLEGARSGKIVTIIFDREPPGGSSLRALGFTQDQKEGITKDSLESGYLPVTAYAWYGMDVGDFITPWVSELPPSEDSQDQYLISDEEIEIGGAGTSTKLLFPASSFQGIGDRYFAYQLRDKLGNTSKLSPTVMIPVNL